VRRSLPGTARVPPAVAAAVVLAIVVAVTVGLLRSLSEPSRGAGAEGGPDTCVAAPDAGQQDIDPDDSPEAPWPHTRGERVVVHFAVAGLPDRYAGLVDQAAEIWARSPCVEPVVVAACPSRANCSTVVARERGGDDTDGESDSDDRGGVRRSNTITLYTGLLDDASDNGALATTVHEMGHALGLVHRLDPDSVMNAETNDSTDPVPDAIDFTNLVTIYG
jgi:Zn-dependent protease with chaperone function